MQKTKLIIALLIVGITGTSLAYVQTKPIALEGERIQLSNETHEIGEFYIDPSNIELTMADSYTFMSYTQEETREVNTQSEWTVLRGDEVPTEVLLDDCVNSSECTVYIGDVPGELTLTAVSGNDEASATINVPDSVEVTLGFSDDVPKWAAVDIAILEERGIMTGYADGSFGPADNVTRGQFITLLYRLIPFMGLNTSTAIETYDCDIYSDLDETHYAYEPICFAANNSWLEDITLPADTIQADKTITRAEAAQLLTSAILKSHAVTLFPHLDLDEDELETYFYDVWASITFSDVERYTKYAYGIGVADFFEIMTGTSNDTLYKSFSPSSSLNRAETAVIIWRILNQYILVDEKDLQISIDQDILDQVETETP
jgi:hypothetical protein